jgi:hypothetical protein
MTTRSVVILLLCTIVLAGVSWLVVRKPKPVGPPPNMLSQGEKVFEGLSPSMVHGLALTLETGAPAQRIEPVKSEQPVAPGEEQWVWIMPTPWEMPAPAAKPAGGGAPGGAGAGGSSSGGSGAGSSGPAGPGSFSGGAVPPSLFGGTKPKAAPAPVDPAAAKAAAEAKSPTRRWELDASRVRALLRLLAEARVMGTPDVKDVLPESPAPVKLEVQTDGRTRTLRVARRALGGQVLAEADGKLALVSSDLLAILSAPGPSGWRPTRPIGDHATRATSIVVQGQTPGSGFAIERAGSQWLLTAPVRGPADAGAVGAMIGVLETMQVARFAGEDASDKTTRANAGLDEPSARVTFVRQVSAGDGQPAREVKRELILGRPADASGSTLFASVDGGQSIFTLDATKLGALRLDPAALLVRTAAAAPEADVTSIAIVGPFRTVTLAREGERWSELISGERVPPEGGRRLVTQDPQRAKQSLEIVRWFLSSPADAVRLVKPAEPYAGQVRVELRGADGRPLATMLVSNFSISRGAEGGVTLTSGAVQRDFAKPPAELARWLREVSVE